MAASMVGNLTLTGQTTQTAASWTGQWSMEDSNLQSNFQYTSNPNTEIVSLIHPITKTIIHLPISFSGQFDLKQPAYEDQPEHTLQISENNIKFTFKFLRGSSDPNVSQLTVLGKGKNQFGTFEVKGNLDLIHSNGTMLLSKYYVVAPKKSGRAKKAVVKREPVPVSSSSSSSSASTAASTTSDNGNNKKKKIKGGPKKKMKTSSNAMKKRKRGPTAEQIAAKQKQVADKQSQDALIRLGLKVQPNQFRVTKTTEGRLKLLMRQYTECMKTIERITRDDKYGYFINQNMHGDDPLFTNFHASSTFPRYLDDIRDTCERGGYVRVMHTCRDEPGEPGSGGVGTNESQVSHGLAIPVYDVGMKVMALSLRKKTTKKKSNKSTTSTTTKEEENKKRKNSKKSKAQNVGVFFPAKIIDIDKTDGTYLVHFDRFQSKYDEWLTIDCLQRIKRKGEEEEEWMKDDVDNSHKSTAAGGCRKCLKDEDYPNIILCDRCDAEYHLYCLSPKPLERPPKNLWFCESCEAQNHGWNDVEREPREIDWAALLEDINIVFTNYYNFFENKNLQGTIHTEAIRLHNKCKELELCRSGKNFSINHMLEKWKHEGRQTYNVERVDRLNDQNNEPAMTKWRKTPYERRTYVPLKDYEPARSVPISEAEILRKKMIADVNVELLDARGDGIGHADKIGSEDADYLKRSSYHTSSSSSTFSKNASSSSSSSSSSIELTSRQQSKLLNKDTWVDNRWILPEGEAVPGMEVLWDRLITTGRRGPWTPKEFGHEVVEGEVWGMDPYARRSVELSLQEVPRSLRLDVEEMKWFFDGLLLPAMNAPSVADRAHDMRHGLRLVKEIALSRHLKQTQLEKTKKEKLAMQQLNIKNGKGKRGKSKKSKKNATTKTEDTVFRRDENSIARIKTKWEKVVACTDAVLQCYDIWGAHNFACHPKGCGVIANPIGYGIRRGEYVNSYVGELYPPWQWEKKEAIKEKRREIERIARGGKIELPNFWNIRLERPKAPYSRGGYDVMYVDASARGNFCSRMSHSCHPNCGSCVAVVDGKLTIALRALRDIRPGDELTQDYNCVTESPEEFRAAVCLCGHHNCRGSFLYCTAATEYMGVVHRDHRVLHRMAMILQAGWPNEMLSLKKYVDTSDNVTEKIKKSKTTNVKKRKRGGSTSNTSSNTSSSSSSSSEKNKEEQDKKDKQAQKDKRMELPEGWVMTQSVSSTSGRTDKYYNHVTHGRVRSLAAVHRLEAKTKQQVQQQAKKLQQQLLQPESISNVASNTDTTMKVEAEEEDALAELDLAHDARLYSHGLGDSALSGLPRWMIRYASLCLRFVEHENRELPPLLRRAVFLRKQQLAESAIRAGASKEKAMKAAAKAAANNVRSGSHSAVAGEQIKQSMLEDDDERRQSMVGKKVKIFWPLDKTFYVAKIKSYDSDDGPNGKHLVKYELDGKEEALDLDVETIFMCEPSPNDLKNMERDDKKKNSKKKKTSHEKGNEEE